MHETKKPLDEKLEELARLELWAREKYEYAEANNQGGSRNASYWHGYWSGLKDARIILAPFSDEPEARAALEPGAQAPAEEA